MIHHKLGLLIVVQVIGMCVVTYSDNVFCIFEVISRLDYEIDQYLRSANISIWIDKRSQATKLLLI